NTDDSGVGSLRWAVDQINADGSYVIDLSKIGTGTIRLSGVLHTLTPNRNIEFKGSVLGAPTIDGQGTGALFFVSGANVTFSNIKFAKDLGEGGDATGGTGGLVGGGGGAVGAGAAITILSGSVTIDSAVFESNQVVGGAASIAGAGGDSTGFGFGNA